MNRCLVLILMTLALARTPCLADVELQGQLSEAMESNDAGREGVGPGESGFGKTMRIMKNVFDYMHPATWAVLGIDAATKGLTGKHLSELRSSPTNYQCDEGTACYQEFSAVVARTREESLAETPCANPSVIGESKINSRALEVQQHLRKGEHSPDCLSTLEQNMKKRLPEMVFVYD